MNASSPVAARGAQYAARDACSLRGSTQVRVVALRDRDGQALRAVLCTGCGLARCDPIPEPATLDRHYRTHYRIDCKQRSEPSRRHILCAGRVALERLARLPRLPVPVTSSHRALDIGAGGGEFACLLGRATGMAVTGIEPNAGYAGHARYTPGLDLLVSPLHEALPSDEPFDLVTMFHVLEHLCDPGAALARIATLLAPGDLAVVEVPDVEATCQAPGHLFRSACTPWRHHATLQPALQALRRFGSRAGETWALGPMPVDPRAMLDRLFEQWPVARRIPALVAG
jgi:SAM-dependent methyltransferase